MSISHDTRNPSPPWTEETIRNATPFPKPEGAVDHALDRRIRRELDPIERSMLRHIAENADLVDAGMSSGGSNWDLPRFWLLVPAPRDLIDFLATFEIERGEDMGVDTDSEPADDDEPDDDLEPDNDAEQGVLMVSAGCDFRPRAPARRPDRQVQTAPPAAGLAEAPFRPLTVHRAQDRPRKIARMVAVHEAAK